MSYLPTDVTLEDDKFSLFASQRASLALRAHISVSSFASSAHNSLDILWQHAGDVCFQEVVCLSVVSCVAGRHVVAE